MTLATCALPQGVCDPDAACLRSLPAQVEAHRAELATLLARTKLLPCTAAAPLLDDTRPGFLVRQGAEDILVDVAGVRTGERVVARAPLGDGEGRRAVLEAVYYLPAGSSLFLALRAEVREDGALVAHEALTEFVSAEEVHPDAAACPGAPPDPSRLTPLALDPFGTSCAMTADGTRILLHSPAVPSGDDVGELIAAGADGSIARVPYLASLEWEGGEPPLTPQAYDLLREWAQLDLVQCNAETSLGFPDQPSAEVRDDQAGRLWAVWPDRVRWLATAAAFPTPDGETRGEEVAEIYHLPGAGTVFVVFAHDSDGKDVLRVQAASAGQLGLCAGAGPTTASTASAPVAAAPAPAPSCAQEKFTELDAALACPGQVRSLTLQYQTLDAFPPVELLPNLEELTVAYSGITEVPDSLLAAKQLRSLVLAGDPITRLPDLRGLPRLRVLALTKTDLTELPPGICDLALEGLVLKENRLKALPPCLGRASSLVWLNLSRNGLESLPAEIGQLASLEQLDVSANPLRTLPDSIGSLKHLQELWAMDVELSTLPATILGLESLRDLVIGTKKGFSLPAAATKLPSLRRLHVEAKEISLPGALGDLGALKHLYLAGSISALPSSIGDLRSLETLDIHGHTLSSLPPSLGRLTTLRKLTVNGQKQARHALVVPEEIADLRSLEWLVLVSDDLHAVPSFLPKMTWLKFVDLTYNPIPKRDLEALRTALPQAEIRHE